MFVRPAQIESLDFQVIHKEFIISGILEVNNQLIKKVFSINFQEGLDLQQLLYQVWMRIFMLPDLNLHVKVLNYSI